MYFWTVPDQCETPKKGGAETGAEKIFTRNPIAWRPEAERRQGDDLVGGRVGQLQLVRNVSPACPSVMEQRAHDQNFGAES